MKSRMVSGTSLSQSSVQIVMMSVVWGIKMKLVWGIVAFLAGKGCSYEQHFVENGCKKLCDIYR